MPRRLQLTVVALCLFAPQVARADLGPPPTSNPSGGGCNRCSVDGEQGVGGIAFAVLGLFGLVALRRGRRRAGRPRFT